MTIYLRQSTASQEVPLGPFVDSTDGVTAKTGLTIANTDIKVWVAGATTLANKNSGGATHISGGIYYAVLDATDTATIGSLKLFVAVSGALACVLECMVLDEAMYDWWTGTAAPLAPTTAGRTLDVSAGGEAGLDWANVGSPSTSVNLSATTVKALTDAPSDSSGVTTLLSRLSAARAGYLDNLNTGVALTAAGIQAIWDALTSALTTSGSIGKLLVDNINATISSRLATSGYTAPDNSSITAIKAKTDSLAFTVAGKVDSNVKYVNDTQVAGTGASGDEWGPV